MLILYNFGIKIYWLLIFIYHFFNTKAANWIAGRRNIFARIEEEVDLNSKIIWFHFASLGEFEQGRPVLEGVRSKYQDHKLLITFFSPSGYEQKKNYPRADYIYYLPLDTRSNARRFIQAVNPRMVIFTKYEYWYHYFDQLHKGGIPLYIISGIFRESQPFFKFYGSLHRKMLKTVSHFFVQDENSKRLLHNIGIDNVTISGDTRFDRVAENAASPRKIQEVERFCGEAKVLVAGSTWPEDEKLLATLINEYPDWKFIIAPHEIGEEKIKALQSLLTRGSTVRHSTILGNSEPVAAPVLIVDNIGMLSSLYQYGKLAYIGGGFGAGIHNTLEAAAFGIPVIFGPNFHKFLEAKALIEAGGGFSVTSGEELLQVVNRLQEATYYSNAAVASGSFVQRQKGATQVILTYLSKTHAWFH